MPLTNPPQGRLSTCDANPFSTTELIWPAHRPLEDMCTLLKNLPDTILCVKGCAVTPTGCYRVERTVDTCEIQPQLSCDLAQATLVFLAHDDQQTICGSSKNNGAVSDPEARRKLCLSLMQAHNSIHQA